MGQAPLLWFTTTLFWLITHAVGTPTLRLETHSAAGKRVPKQHNALELISVASAREAREEGITLVVDAPDAPITLRPSHWLTVTWKGVADPQYTDWIALYVPADANVSLTAPSKFKYAAEAESHMLNGSGSLRFKIINYRQDMVFGFMRGGLQSPTRAAVSRRLVVANPNEPLQAHLALTADNQQVSVTWLTWNATQPSVQWGSKPDQLTHTAQGSSSTITREDMCGGVAAGVGWVEVGLVHTATMTGLATGQRYYYRFGDPVWGWSDVRSFLSPPRRGGGYLWDHHPLRSAPPSVTPAAAQQPRVAQVSTSRKLQAQASSHTLQAAVQQVTASRRLQAGVRHIPADSQPAQTQPDVRSSAHSGTALGKHSATIASARQSMISTGSIGSAVHSMSTTDSSDTAMQLSSTGAIDSAAQSAALGPSGPVLQGVGEGTGSGAVSGAAAVDGVRYGTDSLFAGQESVRVLLVADMGQAEEDGANSLQEAMYPSLNTTRLLASEGDSFSLTLHCGDLAYSRGYATQWDNFMLQVEAISSKMPYMVLPGNHERDWPGSNDRFDEVMDSGGECGAGYEGRFKMPTSGQDALWYSFDHGPVHFLTYSTEHSTAPGTPQYAFIAQDLANVNRFVTPWVVMAGHRPMYVSSTNSLLPDGDQLVATQLREDLEHLLIKYKVDVTLHGHHHTYQRTCPLANGTCMGYDARGRALGPVHLVIGHGGAGLSMNVEEPPPRFIERLALWWGYARMQASRTLLTVEVISDLDGGVVDTLVLRQSAWQQAGHQS